MCFKLGFVVVSAMVVVSVIEILPPDSSVAGGFDLHHDGNVEDERSDSLMIETCEVDSCTSSIAGEARSEASTKGVPTVGVSCSSKGTRFVPARVPPTVDMLFVVSS